MGLEKIIGYEAIKLELNRILDFMKHKDKYDALGAKNPHGLLLYGEPGVGKTLMANCFIEECERKSFIIRKNMPDGEFVKHIQAIFDEAVKNVPSVILLDDLDKFSNSGETKTNSEEFVTVQSCIDSVKDKDVFVVATVNNIRLLPDSLRRSGRFDKLIYIDSPKEEELTLIIEKLLADKNCSSDVNHKQLAKLLNGESCASLETILNEAALIAGYKNHKHITRDDFIKAYMRDRFNAPESMSKHQNNNLLKISYHEAGHVIVSEILENHSVSLVTNKENIGNIHGFTQYNQSDDYFLDIDYMKNRVTACLGGKAASEIIYGKIDTGAGDDINRAYKICSRFVDDYCGYGFDSFTIEESTDFAESKREEATKKELAKYYELAKKIIASNKEFLDKVAKKLYENDILFEDDIQKIKKSCKIVYPALY